MFTVELDGERRGLSLPQVLEALGKGGDLEFAMLRRHQHHAWFAFLVQLGAIVCHRFERANVSMSAGLWAECLVEISGGDEAWCLVIDDLSKPAFMQPPIPEGSLAVLKNKIATPDALDVLIVSRNHDLKRSTIRQPNGEHWVFALVSLQTMQGFLGAGNYGISRMNGGFASRPCVASVADDDWSGRFTREVSGLLAHRTGLQNAEWEFAFTEGAALLWTLPWDGKTSLPFSRLDPLYIELCRRIRLDENGARAGSSKSARVDSKDRFGDTGDFWTPLNRETRKSLTVPADGFTYKLFSDVAFGVDWISSPAQNSQDLAKEASVVARVLVRGQGETKGYHERLVPIPVQVRRLLGKDGGQAHLGTRSKQMVDRAAVAKRKVLKPAILTLAQGAPDDLSFKDDRFDKRLADFDKAIDDIFFADLFRDIEAKDDDAEGAWNSRLWSLIRPLFDELAESIPSPLSRNFKARAHGERLLYVLARKHLPGAFAKDASHAENHV